MEPFEIMVSESQERMLAVVEPGEVDEVLAVCERWQTGGGGDRRGHRLGDRIRIFRRRSWSATCRCRRWSTSARSTTSSPASRTAGSTGTSDASSRRRRARRRRCWRCSASPTIASKRWAFEQYDSIVGSRTVRRPEAPTAAVLQIPEAAPRSRSRSTATGAASPATPTRGTVEAVLECAANLACVGAEPLGLTNCLNFGNPEKPAVAWQLDRSTQGLADACEALGSRSSAATSRSTTRPSGARSTRRPSSAWSASCPTRPGAGAGAARRRPIALVGPFAPSLAGSELAKLRGELGPGLPAVELTRAADALGLVARRPRRWRCARHDVSDGGLATRSPRWRSPAGSGSSADLDELVEARGCSGETGLFGEGPGGFVVAGAPARSNGCSAAPTPASTRSDR